MKRDFPSQVDELQRNVRRCGPSRSPARHVHRAAQRSTSLQIQSLAPNHNVQHQSRTSDTEASTSGSLGAPYGLRPLAGSQSLISAGDERGASFPSEITQSAYEPLIRSTAPHLRSQIPTSEERLVSRIQLPTRSLTLARSTTTRLSDLVSSRNTFEALSQTTRALSAVILSGPWSDVNPDSSAPGSRQIPVGTASNHSQNQNPRILDDEHQNMLILMINIMREELSARGVSITEVNRGVNTPELSKCVKKVVCSREQDQAEQCIICLEHYGNGDEIGQLKCSHMYHLACIRKWMEEHAFCPLCRCRVAPF